jgi:glycosyltransferase involved in cell wall biosynthesis
LTALEEQQTAGLFSHSVVVVDNDRLASAASVVHEFGRGSAIPVGYYIQPEQSIARARNTAVDHARGDFLAFIDDDEIPGPHWLLALYQARAAFAADGVLGPVIPAYEVDPPAWVRRGRFHERPSHDTGTVLHWTNTRTGNVLLRRGLFDHPPNRFRLAFGSGGEDRDFFRRMIADGHRFVWCDDAPVYEWIPADRCTRWSMVKRAFLRGQLPHFTRSDIVRSLLAIPVYTVSLPLLAVVGHHLFMKYLIRNCDHIGRVLSWCGVRIIKETYV